MNKPNQICFLASDSEQAQSSLELFEKRFGNCQLPDADVIVALGGDGFMLQTLHNTRDLVCPVYGMNRGSAGFLMNEYQEENLIERLEMAEEEVINPLRMNALDEVGTNHIDLAINEVSLFRAGPQAIKLQIIVDGKVRMEELVCDGALVATPAGSTAYNYSAHGPILPIGSDVLALTAMAAFRPRRWRGALLPSSAKVEFRVLENGKRPCRADADGNSAYNIVSVTVESDPSIKHKILFDRGHGLQERLISEQFY